MKTIVYYHDNCTDGFGAAFCVYKSLGRENVEYVPCNYGDAPPPAAQYAGNKVVILDFSFPLDIMKHIFALAEHTTWLDHHKTAFEAFGRSLDEVVHDNTEKYTIVLDNSRSGAALAFDWFFGGDNGRPAMIDLIDDRDRWQFKLKWTREFHEAIQMAKPWTFEQWDHLDALFYSDPAKLTAFIERGETALEVQRRHVESAVRHASPCVINTIHTSHEGLAVNSTVHASEIGNELATAGGTYGLIYTVKNANEVIVSLRSNGDYDVSAIAKHFGGGGHKNAAGFRTNVETLLRIIG
jgi:oligoribonuclease NrnB/cAMP/cGMP phosphodiesterase (DHH superfamily)